VATSVLAEVIRHIGRLAGLRGDLAAPDEQLLRRFIDTRDEAAFTAIVSRHGPMVLCVCRQLLRDPNDVDDAFQATFLVLVRKARSVRKPELLGNWLYGVAYKVAARARANRAKRRTREGQENDMTAFPAASVPADADLRSLIHEEVHRLPDKYRGPVVLCFLENKTHEEAAQTLRWPIGSVKGRLARAKELLRSRLARRGVTTTAGGIVATLAPETVSAAIPTKMLETTIKVAMAVAAGKTVAAGLVSAHAVALSEGVIHTMFWNKLKFVAAFVFSLTLLGGAGVLAYQGVGKEPEKKAEQAKETPKEAAKPKDDNKVLQGDWRVVTVEWNGNEISSDEIEKMKDARWTFADGKLSFVTQETESRFSVTWMNYKLDPEHKPKEFDVLDGRNWSKSPIATGEITPRPIRAIYVLDADTLKIATPLNFSVPQPPLQSQTRPTEIATKKGDNTLLITLRRYKGVSEYDYPDAKSKDSSTMASRVHQTHLLSDDDIETVRMWYETKFGIEHDKELGHHGTQSRANGDIVSQVANDSTDQRNGVTTARPVKVYFLTQDTHYHWAQILLTRAEGEKQTHIVVTFVPKR
jgi:RNA polymerase sigma factor (sigma-70 family)